MTHENCVEMANSTMGEIECKIPMTWFRLKWSYFFEAILQNVNVHICLHNFSPLLCDDKKHQTLAAGGTNLQNIFTKVKQGSIFFLQLICNLQVVQPLYSFYESIVKCPPPLTSKRRRTFLKMGRYWFLASTGQSFMLSYTF